MYKRSAKGWAKHLDFILLDCLCLGISFYLAYVIRHGMVNPFVTFAYREIFCVIMLINFLVILFLDTMKDVLKRGYYKEFAATVMQGVIMLLCVSTYMFSTKAGIEYSRITIFLMVIIYVILTYIIRLIWKKQLKKRRISRSDNALLIMAGEDRCRELIEELLENNFGYHKIVGAVIPKDDKTSESIEDIPVVASYDTVVEYVTNHWVDEVLISVNSDDEISEEVIDDLALMGVTVHLNLTKFTKRVGVKQEVGNIGELLVISSSMNFMTPRQYLVKRTMDILGGVIGCFITGILYLILAPLIKMESPGPVFFTQERIGKNGKPFKIYKFRSMYLDAEERKAELMSQNRLNNDFMFKMDFDPRVIGNKIDENGKRKTGIGEFIRKYSIDEFPQFINVLKGEMSMVGTRPPLTSEYEEYSAHHKARLAAKPGITGLWQVSGRSDILDFEEVIQLDTEYINNWSVGMDLRILVKTFKVVLKKEGSM